MDTCKMCGSNNFFGGVYSPLQMPDDKWCKNVDKCKSYTIDKLIKENKELYSTIESLEEKYEEYQSIANDYAEEENTNMYGDYIGTPKSLNKYIDNLIEENNKLKNIQDNDKNEMYKVCEDLQTENKEYCKMIDELKEHPPIYESELKELKSTIESLEEQLELSKQLVSLTEKQVEVVKKDEAKRYREQMNESMRLMKENNELKEQVLKKDKIISVYRDSNDRDAIAFNHLLDEKIELKEENIKIRLQLSKLQNNDREVPSMFNVIEELNKEYSELQDKYEEVKEDYEYQKRRHIETSEKLEIMNFIEQFSDSQLVGRNMDWFEQNTLELFCDEALEHFPDNKDMFYKSIRCKYDLYEDKIYTYEELEQFNIECQKEDNEDFDIELYTEEEIIEYCEGQCSCFNQVEIEGVRYFVLVE